MDTTAKAHLPIMASGYAHRIPHKPSSKRFDSGPQIFRKSFEFHPNGNATQPTIMLIANLRMEGEKENEIILINLWEIAGTQSVKTTGIVHCFASRYTYFHFMPIAHRICVK